MPIYPTPLKCYPYVTCTKVQHLCFCAMGKPRFEIKVCHRNTLRRYCAQFLYYWSQRWKKGSKILLLSEYVPCITRNTDLMQDIDQLI